MLTPENTEQKHLAVSPPKLLDQVRNRLRVKHYSIRTEQAYVDWIKRFIWFQGKRHPKDMGAQEVEAFLTHLAVKGRVSASTQNQAFNAEFAKTTSHVRAAFRYFRPCIARVRLVVHSG